MRPLRPLRRLWVGLWGPGGVPIWYDPSFRLPITSLGARHGLEPRRADFVAWYLSIEGWVHPLALRAPDPVRFADLARVHTSELLTSLTDGDRLAQVFQADEAELRVDEVMLSVRRACGATLEGARLAVAHRTVSLSLLGGFHHAFPDKAGGLCPVNDIAVAVAAVRAEGFVGSIAVLDLDAHPPDGTAACLAGDDKVWIGSISASDWGPVPGADETVLPPGSGDAVYLAALDALLARMPAPQLAFVIAGGDVLAGDRFGQLTLTLDGARRRDLAVMQALEGIGAVWLPGGGYTSQAWKALAGTALALCGHRRRAIPDINPLDLQFDRIAAKLDGRALGGDEDWLDAGELEEELGLRRRGDGRHLGTYTAQGLELALHAYGILGHLERLGYSHFRVALDQVDVGERMRVFGRDDLGTEHLLGESVVERRTLVGRPVVFVHWLTLRHPAGTFGSGRPQLPGQEVPGLGLSLEAVELLERAARRTGAEGVAFRPSFYHTAWLPSEHARFVDDAREGRFEALMRDLGHLDRAVLSKALQEGRVRCNGEPYAWEAEPMVFWLDGRAAKEPAVDAERSRVRFSLLPLGDVGEKAHTS